MKGTIEIPVIQVATDDSGDWILFATSYGSTTPAGERLFRGFPRPDLKWRHPDKAEAEADAVKLRAYLAESWDKAPSARKLRSQHD